ncbi:MAG: hypothetical protein M0C28_13695, partial [Candidatus Moduliflexus flocculans]|nr:hypothetical protein [Candidatus Moduliflexus flocculans]
MIFVGKSLTAEGGQNPIEPGALGKAMVFGPNMQNFAEIASNLVAKKGALQVRDADELESAIERLLSDGNLRAELGSNALKVVKANLGAIDRTVEMIVSISTRQANPGISEQVLKKVVGVFALTSTDVQLNEA